MVPCVNLHNWRGTLRKFILPIIELLLTPWQVTQLSLQFLFTPWKCIRLRCFLVDLQFFKDSKTSCASSSSVTWPVGFFLEHFLTCCLSSVHQHGLLGLSYQYHMPLLWFSSVQSLSRVRLFATPWTATHQASLSTTNSQSLPRLMSIESVMPSNHLILHRPLLLLPSIFPSIRVFFNEPALCLRWPKSKILELQLQHQSFQWTPRTDLP